MTDSKSQLECDIAIVGGGIAGPALAAALTDSQLRIIIVERSTKPPDTCRGDQLQPRTCEYLARWGVLNMMLECGAEKRLGSRWITGNGELMLDARVDNLPIPHPYYLYLNHELINTVLLKRAAVNPNFSLLRPAKGRIERDETGAGHHKLVVKQDDELHTVHASCIAIADGRTSMSRRRLGISSETYAYRNPLLTLFADRVEPDERNDLLAILTPSVIVTAVPRMGARWKIGFPVDVKSLSSWKSASDSEVRQRLAQIAPILVNLEPKVSSVYPVSKVDAERWSDGNCVLLGDACHTLHPGRSQGMNIAFANVASLAERLQSERWQDSHKHLLRLLSDFEADQRPGIDARLADNHKRGLEMDNLSSAQIKSTINEISELASRPGQLQKFFMNAAGY